MWAVSPELPANTPTAVVFITKLKVAADVQVAPSSECDTVQKSPDRPTRRNIGSLSETLLSSLVLALPPLTVAAKTLVAPL